MSRDPKSQNKLMDLEPARVSKGQVFCLANRKLVQKKKKKNLEAIFFKIHLGKILKLSC